MKWIRYSRYTGEDLGILNGQRGTVRDIDQNGRILDVELDGGKKVTLDERYLDAGRLDHGYAITAHRAQGATVDRTFVLGSDEAYADLGTYWGHVAPTRQDAAKEKPWLCRAFVEWAVQESNLQPWD